MTRKFGILDVMYPVILNGHGIMLMSVSFGGVIWLVRVYDNDAAAIAIGSRRNYSDSGTRGKCKPIQ